jgi:hypothetical protein
LPVFRSSFADQKPSWWSAGMLADEVNAFPCVDVKLPNKRPKVASWHFQALHVVLGGFESNSSVTARFPFDLTWCFSVHQNITGPGPAPEPEPEQKGKIGRGMSCHVLRAKRRALPTPDAYAKTCLY